MWLTFTLLAISLGCLANNHGAESQDFVKAKKVADMIMHTRQPMFMLPSSSMLESNDNYLKRNPFKR